MSNQFLLSKKGKTYYASPYLAGHITLAKISQQIHGGFRICLYKFKMEGYLNEAKYREEY